MTNTLYSDPKLGFYVMINGTGHRALLFNFPKKALSNVAVRVSVNLNEAKVSNVNFVIPEPNNVQLIAFVECEADDEIAGIACWATEQDQETLDIPPIHEWKVAT